MGFEKHLALPASPQQLYRDYPTNVPSYVKVFMTKKFGTLRLKKFNLMKHGTLQEKNKNCSSENKLDETKGDAWDHVALEAVDKLVVSLVVGPRTSQSTDTLVADFHKRTNGKLPELITTDEYKPYKTAFMKTYGTTVPKVPTGKKGRPKKPDIQMLR